MAKLRADRKNYKKAFTTHADAYDKWNIGSPYSQRLLYVTVWNVALSV